MQKLRIAAANLIEQLPAQLQDSDDVKLLKQEADDKVCNIVHLIYRSQKYEGIAKDFEFSRRTMEEHWKTGYHNAEHTLGIRKFCSFRIGWKGCAPSISAKISRKLVRQPGGHAHGSPL